MSDDVARTADFWRLFGRVMGRRVEPASCTPASVPEWDSLRHVELVFELEETFRLSVPPEQIAHLYTGTDEILEFLRQAARP